MLIWYFVTHPKPLETINEATRETYINVKPNGDGGGSTQATIVNLKPGTNVGGVTQGSQMAGSNGTTQETAAGSEKPWLNMRIPDCIVPFHYEVDLKPLLHPDPSDFYWFYGRSAATFAVTNSTSVIVIHSNKLNYTNVEMSQNVS